MPAWLILAKGPLFRFTLALLFVGLVRLALISIWETASAIAQAGDRRIPIASVVRETLGWLLPVFRLHSVRGLYSYASFVFHLGILFAGLFLANHLDIFRAATGFAWPAIAKPVLDVFTLASILTGIYLLSYRLYVKNSRLMSGFMDYLLPGMILSIFASGYIAGRPWNPIPYDSLMLFHAICGIVLLALIPFTKIAHCVLFPLIRLSSEVAWHFTPHGGSETIRTLYGPGGRKI